MTRQEFDERCKVSVSASDYEKIEIVYTWHPSISETEGKDQIAMLVENFGMRIIEDMLPTARKAQRILDKISKIKQELRTAEAEYDMLKLGEIN